MINSFLYSVYDQNSARLNINDPAPTEYRNRWFSALIAFGSLEAQLYPLGLSQTPRGADSERAKALLPRSLSAHASSGFTGIGRRYARTGQSGNCSNAGEVELCAGLSAASNPGAGWARTLIPYGEDSQPTELVEIPSFDLPAGIPAWMRNTDEWATRRLSVSFLDGDRPETGTSR
jgi:hypothetical protein